VAVDQVSVLPFAVGPFQSNHTANEGDDGRCGVDNSGEKTVGVTGLAELRTHPPPASQVAEQGGGDGATKCHFLPERCCTHTRARTHTHFVSLHPLLRRPAFATETYMDFSADVDLVLEFVPQIFSSARTYLTAATCTQFPVRVLPGTPTERVLDMFKGLGEFFF
jgi:hypothetical protein